MKSKRPTRHHRKGSLALLAALACAAAAFYYALTLDEGTKKHIRKRIKETARMPGRLLT